MLCSHGNRVGELKQEISMYCHWLTAESVYESGNMVLASQLLCPSEARPALGLSRLSRFDFAMQAIKKIYVGIMTFRQPN